MPRCTKVPTNPRVAYLRNIFYYILKNYLSTHNKPHVKSQVFFSKKCFSKRYLFSSKHFIAFYCNLFILFSKIKNINAFYYLIYMDKTNFEDTLDKITRYLKTKNLDYFDIRLENTKSNRISLENKIVKEININDITGIELDY